MCPKSRTGLGHTLVWLGVPGTFPHERTGVPSTRTGLGYPRPGSGKKLDLTKRQGTHEIYNWAADRTWVTPPIEDRSGLPTHARKGMGYPQTGAGLEYRSPPLVRTGLGYPHPPVQDSGPPPSPKSGQHWGTAYPPPPKDCRASACYAVAQNDSCGHVEIKFGQCKIKFSAQFQFNIKIIRH